MVQDYGMNPMMGMGMMGAMPMMGNSQSGGNVFQKMRAKYEYTEDSFQKQPYPMSMEQHYIRIPQDYANPSLLSRIIRRLMG